VNAIEEHQMSALWASAPSLGAAELVRQVDALLAHRADTDARALFERASARDYADREQEAAPLYVHALDLGLDEPFRARATIQLASTLRNLGRAPEAIEVLQSGFAEDPDHPLADAARAFLALCLADTGDLRAATAVALDALSTHLPEYSRAVRAYAGQLVVE
jgi:tetratricopeptide (TPR) repeat protein